MSPANGKLGLCVLRWSLGIVILIEAILFLSPVGAHGFARTHLPSIVRWILGYGEILGCVLLLIPQTVRRGAWLLLALFVMAILIHLLHGIYGVSNLVIYAAAAFAIAVGEG
jgi:uncharacterized membrane protein YphA (DoxX/SURF4 family)